MGLSAHNLIGGFVFFITACLIGFILSWYGGMLIDGFYNNELNGEKIVPDSLLEYAASPVYDDMSGLGQEVYYVNLFYFLAWFCPILGAIVLYQTLFKDESTETYIDPYTASGNTWRRRP